MSITMQRMIDLIASADAIVNAYTQHTELIKNIVRVDISHGGRIANANLIFSNPNSSSDELRSAARICQDVIQGWMEQATSLQFPLQAMLVLERERTHFRYNKRKNELNADAVRLHRARKEANETLRAEGITPITSRKNMPSLNTGISESPLNQTSEELDRFATEARLRAEAYMRGEDPDKAVPSGTYTREDYERDRDARLRESPAPISVVRSTDSGNS